jgi:hypothetical protein
MGNFSIAQKGTTSFGLQLKPIVPVSYFQAGPLNLSDTIVDIEIKQTLGYSMGMIIRHNITNLISFETGINYVRRNYAIAATSKIGTLNDQLEFGFVNYEIPLQALVYVQLSKRRDAVTNFNSWWWIILSVVGMPGPWSGVESSISYFCFR